MHASFCSSVHTNTQHKTPLSTNTQHPTPFALTSTAACCCALTSTSTTCCALFSTSNRLAPGPGLNSDMRSVGNSTPPPPPPPGGADDCEGVGVGVRAGVSPRDDSAPPPAGVPARGCFGSRPPACWSPAALRLCDPSLALYVVCGVWIWRESGERRRIVVGGSCRRLNFWPHVACHCQGMCVSHVTVCSLVAAGKTGV